MVPLTLFIVLMQMLKHVAMLSCGQPGPTVPHFSNVIPSHYWPWHAAIFRKASEAVSPTYRCSGTLVTANWIITAGRCVSTDNLPMDPETVSVSLGDEVLGESTSNIQTFNVIKLS